ncbi:MAG TPA: hypothetical protein VIS96_17265 [Terrimicrobiaceae bacterium]
MNRAAVIEQLRQTRETLDKLLALLEASQGDKFAAHVYQSRKDYRRTCDIAGKSGKQIERCVISTFQVAQSLGFNGEFRQWEYLLRVDAPAK